jgi:hypothetical protein
MISDTFYFLVIFMTFSCNKYNSIIFRIFYSKRNCFFSIFNYFKIILFNSCFISLIISKGSSNLGLSEVTTAKCLTLLQFFPLQVVLFYLYFRRSQILCKWDYFPSQYPLVASRAFSRLSAV